MENNKEILEEVDDINIVKESNDVKESNNVEEPQQNIKQEDLKDNNFNVVSPCDKEEKKVTSNEDVIEVFNTLSEYLISFAISSVCSGSNSLFTIALEPATLFTVCSKTS